MVDTKTDKKVLTDLLKVKCFYKLKILAISNNL